MGINTILKDGKANVQSCDFKTLPKNLAVEIFLILQIVIVRDGILIFIFSVLLR